MGNSIITSEAPSQNEPEPSQSKDIENSNPPVASPIPPASETISTNEKDEEEEDDKPRPPDDDEYINNNISNDEEGDVSPFATTPNPSKSAKTIGEKSASDLDNDDL